VHLVGFTIEIYYDARYYKRQTERFLGISVEDVALDCGAVATIRRKHFVYNNSKG